MQLYSEILDAGGPPFGAILCHVRDSQMMASSSIALVRSPLSATTFCLKSHLAGKDRAGIAAALHLVRPSLHLHRP
jgi:hypothetical protein